MKVDLGLSLRYYKNPEVQELLVAAAANKEIGTRFGDKFGKMMNSYDIKIVQNALAMAKQQAVADKQKGAEQTPKLIA